MGPKYTCECVVVGAGVIGLAIARALALMGKEVIVLEAENNIGMHTSSRNSEVIHAGIYYPENSLKAKCCVKGKKLLYEYLDKFKIDYRRCGKLIVANSAADEEKLIAIQKKAEANGVDDLTFVNKARISALEPEIRAELALLSPSTGILDTHQLMLNYLGEAEANGAVVAYNSPLTQSIIEKDGFLLILGDKDKTRIKTRTLINSGGLFAHKIAQNIEGLQKSFIPKTYYAKGNYFGLRGKYNFSHLIYPVPTAGGLGIHLTLDISGKAKFGPDVEWVNEINYSVNDSRINNFYHTVRKYWPKLPNDSLYAEYTGIRPKLSGKNAQAKDFIISGPKQHKIQGLVNLFGIESPGITASLAIAEEVLTSLDYS